MQSRVIERANHGITLVPQQAVLAALRQKGAAGHLSTARQLKVALEEGSNWPSGG